MVGRVYAANTAGGIIGAVVTSVLLIGWLGTQRTQQILIAIAAIGAFLMLLPRGLSARAGTLFERLEVKSAGVLLLMLGAAAEIVFTVPAIPWQLVAHGRYLSTFYDDRTKLYL